MATTVSRAAMTQPMTIGVFDSGLGGLVILRALTRHLPAYNFVYLGDTLNVPYGGRSQDTIYGYTHHAADFLFRKKNCQLVLIACNTATAAALHRLQNEYLPEAFPDRRILGVIIPTLETALALPYRKIGLLATESVVRSGIYREELQKMNPAIELVAQAAPLLVPLLEKGGHKWIDAALEDYLAPFQAASIESLILGCTHFPLLKDNIQRLLPNVHLMSQDDIIPSKLADYLRRHPEIETRLSKTGHTEYCVTDISEGYCQVARDLFGRDLPFQTVVL